MIKKLLIAACIVSTPALADPRFHEVTPALRIEANITTVSSMTMTDQGIITENGQPAATEPPTITVDEIAGPFQDNDLHLLKTIQKDF